MIRVYTWGRETKKIAVCPQDNKFPLLGSYLGSEIFYKKDGSEKYHKHYLKDLRNIPYSNIQIVSLEIMS